MTDYKEKFDRWQKKATEKFEEIDSQLGLKKRSRAERESSLTLLKKGLSS